MAGAEFVGAFRFPKRIGRLEQGEVYESYTAFVVRRIGFFGVFPKYIETSKVVVYTRFYGLPIAGMGYSL